MTTTPIRIVIADDYPVVLEGLRNQIAKAPHIEIVGSASSFAEVSTVLAQVSADVLILDLIGMDGPSISTVTGLRLTYPQVKVIIFSSSIDLAPEILKAGARGYLTKEELLSNLVEAIIAVHSGQEFLSPNVRRFLDQTSRLSELTAQDVLVLKLNAQGLLTEEIAEQMGLTFKTVNNYFSGLREKTGCRSRVQMAEWYRRHYGDPSSEAQRG